MKEEILECEKCKDASQRGEGNIVKLFWGENRKELYRQHLASIHPFNPFKKVPMKKEDLEFNI